MFALAYANMRFHGDGKSNLYSCSSLLKDSKNKKGIAGIDAMKNKEVTLVEELKYKFFYDKHSKSIQRKARTIDLGMINPPYSLKSTKTKENKNEKQSGQSELDFVYSMLTYIKKGGIGIAIVPMSCASNKGKKLRETILNEHTLLACMSMPKQLFQNSKVGTSTCIMVFKAHIPHMNSTNSVFLARWLNDGFVTIPHQGRSDRNDKWLTRKSEWLLQLKGQAKANPTVYMKRSIGNKEETLAEAYIETDWSSISENNFIEQLKKYSLFKYCESEGIEGNDKEILFILLDNLESFEEKYSSPYDNNNEFELKEEEWKEFNVTQLFELTKGEFYPVDSFEDGETSLITASDTNNGIMKKTNLDPVFEGNCITVGKVGMSAFYQESQFVCSHDVTVLKSNNPYFNKYIAMFFIGLLSMEKYRWDYGRQIQLNACKTVNIKVPIMYDNNGEAILDREEKFIPDYDFMEKYIKSLNYSKAI